MVDALYTFARYVYDCGDYSRAATNLGLYRALVSSSLYEKISILIIIEKNLRFQIVIKI
jgi:hypothetical protein